MADSERADQDAILALEREWPRRFRAKDVEWIVAQHAPDAQQFPPHAPAVVGLDAIREAWAAMAGTEGLDLDWQPEHVTVAASRDLAYDRGRGTMTTPDGAKTPVKYVVVWKRVAGEWKVALDMFSPDN